MDKLLSYGLMILVVAVLYLLYWRKTRPVRDACDRFGSTFMEARDYAVGEANCPPLVEKGDSVRLLPLESQSEAVRSMLARGRSREMAQYDETLELILRELFQHIGKNQHYKSRYFDYLNTFFTLHKLFLQVCAAPDTAMIEADWKNLAIYTGSRQKLVHILSMRLSDRGRQALSHVYAAQQLNLYGKEEFDEAL